MKPARRPPLHVVVRTAPTVLLDVPAHAVDIQTSEGNFALRPGSGPILAALGPTHLVVRLAAGGSIGVEMSWGTLTVAGSEVRVLAHDAELEQVPLAS
jgi:F0F1-type ATP synthase epsilon subunit